MENEGKQAIKILILWRHTFFPGTPFKLRAEIKD